MRFLFMLNDELLPQRRNSANKGDFGFDAEIDVIVFFIEEIELQ